jgi:hypothetical protein
VRGRLISRSALRAPLRPSAERKRPADAAIYGTAEAVPLSKTDLQTGQGVGGWGGVERREEWRSGRQPQPASWPGTPGRAGQRVKSARRGRRLPIPRTKTCPRGPRFSTPRTKTCPRGPRFAPSRDAPISESRVGVPGTSTPISMEHNRS